jgi:hypothetical protein
VGIKVSGLGEIPHICSKQEDKLLEIGKIYVRSMGKPESTEVCNYIEMKEILDICLENSVSNYITRLSRIGILDTLKITLSDKEKYDNEVEDLK